MRTYLLDRSALIQRVRFPASFNSNTWVKPSFYSSGAVTDGYVAFSRSGAPELFGELIKTATPHIEGRGNHADDSFASYFRRAKNNPVKLLGYGQDPDGDYLAIVEDSKGGLFAFDARKFRLVVGKTQAGSILCGYRGVAGRLSLVVAHNDQWVAMLAGLNVDVEEMKEPVTV